MFNIFSKRKSKCEVCQLSSDQGIIVGYDPTDRGEFSQNGEKQKLCLTHFKEKFLEDIKSFDGFAACFLPKKKWNSYSYISLDKAKEWNISEKDITEIKVQLQQASLSQRCSYCPSAPHFLFYNYAYEPDFYKKKLVQKPKVFCARHLVEQIVLEIKSRNLQIDEINLPYGAFGLYMHGDY